MDQTSTGKNKNIVYIVIAVIVVAVIAYVVYFSPSALTTSSTTGATGTNANVNLPAPSPKLDPTYVAAKKAEIVKRIYDPKPLTLDEKKAIFQAIGGDRIIQFNFSEAERAQLMKAMNK